MGLVICVILVLVIILCLFKPTCYEGLISKPTDIDIKKFTSEVIGNKEVFHNGSFYNAREKMPWIDPIAYEEIRMLANQNNLDNNSIISVFN